MGVYYGAPCHGYALNYHFVYLVIPGTRPSRVRKRIYLFYLYATIKSEIHICSNKYMYETSLVHIESVNCSNVHVVLNQNKFLNIFTRHGKIVQFIIFTYLEKRLKIEHSNCPY